MSNPEHPVITGSSKLWMIIYPDHQHEEGAESEPHPCSGWTGPPGPCQEEIDAAEAIAQLLTEYGNVAKVFPDHKPINKVLFPLSSLVCIGGSKANQFTKWIMPQSNPKVNYVEVEDGGVLLDESTYDYVDEEGMLHQWSVEGHTLYTEVHKPGRPRFKMVILAGYTLENTLAATKAFLDGAPPGVYSTTGPTQYDLVGGPYYTP